MINKKYFFYIEPHVYISLKKNDIFLYNSLNGKSLEYKDDSGISNLLRRIIEDINLLSVEITEDELEVFPGLKKFVYEIRESFMGDLLDSSVCQTKPFQMRPNLKIKEDLEKKGHNKSNLDMNVLKYINEISLFINGECDQNCSICHDAYKQFLFCNRAKDNNEIPIPVINDLLKYLKDTSIFKINILGGNIFKYRNLKEILILLKNIPVEKNFYSHYLNVMDNKDIEDLFNEESFLLTVFVDFPVDDEKLNHLYNLTQKNGNVEILFVLKEDMDIQSVQRLVSRFSFKKVTYRPYLNGNNFDFFKKHIFIGKQKILEAQPSLKEIHSRGKFNQLNFGKLFIMNDGAVYSNLNNSPLGNLKNKSLLDIVFSEITGGKSWRRIRENVKPCNDCVYNNLCPPLSNYEYAIGRNNLCNIFNPI